MNRIDVIKVKLAGAIAGCFLLAVPAFAAHPEEKSEIENLKKRIKLLENQGSETNGAEETQGAFGHLNRFITLHGLIEVEASYTKPEGSDEESDLTLATAELSFQAILSDLAGGHLTLLYEEEPGEDDDIDVDEAVISLTSPREFFGQTLSVHAGRMYVPFGMFNSYMITDPLTLDLGETQDTAALIALEGGGWAFQTCIFNGDADAEGDDDKVDSWVAALEMTVSDYFKIGASYISDLAESDAELVEDGETTPPYSSSVSGASAFLSARFWQFGFEAEYLAALEDFDSELVAAIETDLTGERPEAWNLELAWFPSDRLLLATRYEKARDFQNDVKRYGAAVSYGLHENLVLAIEYLHADTDSNEDDPVHTAIAQLALEF